jgi:hypothetical protein
MRQIKQTWLLLVTFALGAGCTGIHHETTTSQLTAVSIGRGKFEGGGEQTILPIARPPLPMDEPKKENAKNGNDKEEEEPKHIRDNGFLVEEAFNQEPGEVQHIFNWINAWDRTSTGHTRDFLATYTMELPLGTQKHQFSFTAQFQTAFEKPNVGPATQQGDVGDTFLNYRYQLLANDEFLWCAPRFSLILPTGDKYLRTGTGEVGYQFNLPVSHYGEQFDVHFNAGYTITPDVSLPVSLAPSILSPRHDLDVYNLGASVFWKPKVNLHFFVEALALWSHEIDDLGSRVSTTQVFINPGLRFAVIQEPLEWVLGVSAPIGLTRDAPDIGVFAYMSIEHPFRKKKNGE